VVPPKFAQPYADEVTYRKIRTRLLRQSSTLLKAMVIRLTRRLRDPKLPAAGDALAARAPAAAETIDMCPVRRRPGRADL